MVHQQALRLQEFRVAIDRGAQAEQLLKQARPPVFFKRQPAVQAQLRAWSLSDLVTAGSTLNANVLAARRNAALAEAIAGRCLLSLARKATGAAPGSLKPSITPRASSSGQVLRVKTILPHA